MLASHHQDSGLFPIFLLGNPEKKPSFATGILGGETTQYIYITTCFAIEVASLTIQCPVTFLPSADPLAFLSALERGETGGAEIGGW